MTHHAIKSRTSRVYRIMDFCLLISGIPSHRNHLRIPFFSGALLHLRIRILRLPGVEGAVETVTATQPGSAPLKFDVVRFEGEVENVTFRITQVRR